MTGRVVEEGLDSRPRTERPSSPWSLAVVGFVLGLGLGIFIVGPPDPVPIPTSDTQGESEEPEATLIEEDRGVSAEVEGFPDAVVAVARTTSSSLDHLLWPYAGPLTVRPMAGGETPRFDTSGLYIALTDRVPGETGTVLSMGRFNQIRTVATGVTGFAWHDEDSALLAYTSEREGIWRLEMVRGNFSSEVLLEASAPGARVVAWGDWGFALQNGPEVTLLNAEGVFKDVEEGVVHDSHAGGWLFLTADRPKLVTSGGGVLAFDIDPGVGSISGAVFSPDGARLAVFGGRGISVMDTRGESGTLIPGLRVTSLAWSSDSRFLLVPTSAGVIFHDTETGASYRGLERHAVLAVGVIQLSS